MDLIHEEFQKNYSEFKAVTGLGKLKNDEKRVFVLALSGLYDHYALHTDFPSDGRYEAAIRVIEEFKPDVLFLVSR